MFAGLLYNKISDTKFIMELKAEAEKTFIENPFKSLKHKAEHDACVCHLSIQRRRQVMSTVKRKRKNFIAQFLQ